jgi:L-seryl-tRNA(Ser) seleniumtransferase
MGDPRRIPSIDEIRRRPTIQALEARFGARATIDALRAAASRVRTERGPEQSEADDAKGSTARRIEMIAEDHLARLFRPSLATVINATGVVIHTNLGRAPLSRAAIDRIAEVARGYCSLEYDVEDGGRGRRDVHAETMLRFVTGAEAAVVVNNNAAATLLVLAALAKGREVVVSRGELVEIGGGFRVPDVMRESGAVLREVGTTNKTRASDYAAAVSDRTALILRVHPSNFRIEGFTERPTLADVVAVGKQLRVPVAEDLGSGFLGMAGSQSDGDVAVPQALRAEPSVASSIEAGVDVCCFSGDKLLGGPQAGIIVGRSSVLDRIRRYPLMRALRVDKLTYAALEATLIDHAAGRAVETVPVQRMLAATAPSILERARRFADALGRLNGWRVDVVEGVSAIGGGSAPGLGLPTWTVAASKSGMSANALERRLRELPTAIVARIQDDRVHFDLRTVLPEQDDTLLHALETL